MNPMPFVIAAYAVFAVVFVYDAVAPWLQRRRVLAGLRARAAREARRRGETGGGAAA